MSKKLLILFLCLILFFVYLSRNMIKDYLEQFLPIEDNMIFEDKES